jgi:protein-tyrosine kinase
MTRTASLIERAAQVYDLNTMIRARGGQADAGVEAAASPTYAASAIDLRGGVMAPVDRVRLAEGGYIQPDAAVGVLAEEYRMVKRQLLAAPAGDRSRVILVCSAEPDDGKTFCSINLALSLAAEKDIEVLLVDADVAKPEIVAILGLPEGAGLLDAIADPTLDPERCVIRTDIPNLAVMPSGRATGGATELIASDRTRAVIDRLAADPRRVILFDSPPVLAASPAAVLADHVGQVVMVVRADRTGEAEIRSAIAMLGMGRPLRLLINGVSYAPESRRFGAQYGYGG